MNSYLLPREGRVRVEGALSDVMLLVDMVFQGTVLGPPLWNAFFADEFGMLQDSDNLQFYRFDHLSLELLFFAK